MQQVQAPDATLRVILRFRGEVVGQLYVQATIEDWNAICNRPFANTGDVHQHNFAENTIHYEWIGSRESLT